MESNPAISVVIPVFEEEGNIRPLVDQLVPVLEELNLPFEILFVDDGSKDSTYAAIATCHKHDPRIGYLALSRNFGHQTALLAGLQQSRGDLVVTMDGDLQHPPEVIPELIQKYREGFDIVNTKRIDPPGISWNKKTSSRLYYRLLKNLSEVPIQPAAADFRLMTRRTVDAFLTIEERDRFTRGLVSWMGFRQAIVPYQAAPRHAGRSKYTLKKMVGFGLKGITSFSARPLSIAFYSGVVISLLGFVYGLYAVVQYFRGATIPGWTSTQLTLLIIGGVILINLGILGEYLARVFLEVKRRPFYFIREQVLPQAKNTKHDESQNEKKG